MLEVYEEKILDLLSGSKEPLQIREKDGSTFVCFEIDYFSSLVFLLRCKFSILIKLFRCKASLASQSTISFRQCGS